MTRAVEHDPELEHAREGMAGQRVAGESSVRGVRVGTRELELGLARRVEPATLERVGSGMTQSAGDAFFGDAASFIARIEGDPTRHEQVTKSQACPATGALALEGAASFERAGGEVRQAQRSARNEPATRTSRDASASWGLRLLKTTAHHQHVCAGVARPLHERVAERTTRMQSDHQVTGLDAFFGRVAVDEPTAQLERLRDAFGARVDAERIFDG